MSTEQLRGDDSGAPHPVVRITHAASDTAAVVLLLHGGKEHSLQLTRWRSLPVLRMIGFARSISSHLGAQGVDVWRLRFALRGWNGDADNPVHDARWALAQIRARHPGVPVVLVGHSMGGRTAVRVADDGQVVGVVMLAPWLPPDEPTTSVSGKRVFIAHGAGDRWVPGRMSLAWANRAVGSARELRRVELRGTDHPMLRRSSLWHDLTTYVVARYLDLPFAAPRSMASLDAADPTNLRLAL